MAALQKTYDVVMVRDPFQDMSPAERQRYIDVERKARRKMRKVSKNETFNIGVPRESMPVTMKEPESMTTRSARNNYLVRQSDMKAPVYRGRGRSMRLERDAKDRIKFLMVQIVSKRTIFM